MEDPIIDQKANETIVTINVKLDSFNGEEPSTKTFKYTETGLNAANNMKQVANSLATQMSFSKKGNKVFFQVNLDKDGNPIKGIDRHPILEDNVIVYSNATILGRITIGEGSVIGANIWVTEDMEPNTKKDKKCLKKVLSKQTE